MSDEPMLGKSVDHELPAARRQALRGLLIESVNTSFAQSSTSTAPSPPTRSAPGRSPRRLHAPRRLRTRISLAVVSALAVIGVSGGLAYSNFSPSTVTQQRIAICFSSAKFHEGDRSGQINLSPVTGSPTPEELISRMLTACASAWAQGFIQPGVPNAVERPAESSYPVPELVGCILPNGYFAVFPGDVGTCRRLGLLTAPVPAATP